MKANYHTHTTRCQHAFGEDREYVEEMQFGQESGHWDFPTIVRGFIKMILCRISE